ADTFGPFPDGFHFEVRPVTLRVETELDVSLPPLCQIFCFHIKLEDSHTFHFNAPVRVTTFSYVTLPRIGEGTISPSTNMLVTDISALSLGGPTDLIATGFNPSNPEVVPTSPETFTGQSGTIYSSTVSSTIPNGMSTLGNLGNVLPG